MTRSRPVADRLHVPGDPVADPAAVLTGDRWRLTVLTPGLVRLEWSDTGEFEDRASTFAVHRALPVPAYDVRRPDGDDGRVELDTDCLHLEYDGGPFSPSGLKVSVPRSLDSSHTSVWRYGEPADGLGGTTRTLDEADGAVPIGGGVVSRNGIAVIDDSGSFLLEDGAPASRRAGNRDLYVFARGFDYRAAVADLHAVSGPVPRLPRWTLGNRWSRYHPYSATEYLELLDRFDDERVPLSVAVIDMDWHWVDIDPRHGVGWTGYSWNTDLFPDPPAFLRELHERGLRVTLNVHPADGVRSFEDAYPEMAAAMGLDPDSGRTVAFDPTDPTFMDAYFELLHHPLEDDGVDFWWLDWQQGAHTRVPGVDPLWLLNIAHYNDSGRDGDVPLTFSRYAGPGSHRYPLGFSGDTVISWESLDFQPHFTATASNIGYGWWSHDIGGHLWGRRDDELSVRWVQLGCFSPVLRLHSTLHPFIRKEPWSFPAEARTTIDRFLRLRHRLVPYLHSMNVRAAEQSLPLVEPMYWEHPEQRSAYEVPSQFRFGTEVVVAAITAPQHPQLRLGSTRAWLPEGGWTDLLTGTRYAGGREVRLHRPADGYPVLLPDGALLPLAGEDDDAVGVEHPEVLELVLAPGADGSFDLVEDDGSLQGARATTPLRYDAASGTLRLGPVEGATDVVPASRAWHLTVLGATARVTRAGDTLPGSEGPVGTRVELGATTPGEELVVTLADVAPYGWARTQQQVFDLLHHCQVEHDTKLAVHRAVAAASGAATATAAVRGLELDRPLEDAVLELVLADPAAQA